MKHLNLVKGGFLIHKGEIKPIVPLKSHNKNMNLSSLSHALPHVPNVGEGVRKHVKAIKPLKYKF